MMSEDVPPNWGSGKDDSTDMRSRMGTSRIFKPNKELQPESPDQTAKIPHDASDVDAHKLALHHTIGTGWNQSASGQHRHDGITGPNIPASSIAEIAAGLQSYTPAWTASGTAPAIGNGSLKGRYLKLGALWIVFLDWFSGSTSTYGTGTWSFSLPSAPGINSTVPGAPIGMLNNGGFHWPVSGYFTGTTVGPIVANNADIVGANDPATRAWAAGSFLRLTCIYES